MMKKFGADSEQNSSGRTDSIKKNFGGLSMNQRFRITRSMQQTNPEQSISLEECKHYFAAKSDFTYSQVFIVKGPDTSMSIAGDFFMWTHEDMEIPFRLYMGEVYVAISNEAVVPKMLEIATDLHADVVEG